MDVLYETIEWWERIAVDLSKATPGDGGVIVAALVRMRSQCEAWGDVTAGDEGYEKAERVDAVLSRICPERAEGN